MAGRSSHLQFAYNLERDCKSHAEELPVEGILLGLHQSNPNLPFRIWPAPTQKRW